MSKKEKLLFFSVVLICLGLRLAFITQKNLWFDEIFSWRITLGSFENIIALTSSDIHPPFYYFILKLWIIPFGDSVLSMRLLSALVMTSSLFFLYPLAKRIFNVQMSLLVILLYALSPLNIFYAQEVRMSALNLFLNLGAVYYLLKLIDINDGLFKNKYTWLFLLFSIATVYNHYFSFLIIAAEIIFLFYLHFKKLVNGKKFIPLFVIVILSYIPWFPIMFNQIKSGQQWRIPQNVIEVAIELLRYFRDISMGQIEKMSGLFLFSAALLISIVSIISVGGYIKRIKNEKISKAIFLVSTLFITPLIVAIILSFKQRIEFFRYLSILIPYFLICFVYSITVFRNKFIYLIAAGLFVSLNIWGLGLHYAKDYKNNDYRALINTMNDNFEANDKIYVEPHYYGWIIDYYQSHEALKIPAPEKYGWGFNMLMDSIKSLKPNNFWFVLDYSTSDTLNYPGYLERIKANYNQTQYYRFNIIPNDVELYKFRVQK